MRRPTGRSSPEGRGGQGMYGSDSDKQPGAEERWHGPNVIPQYGSKTLVVKKQKKRSLVSEAPFSKILKSFFLI
jgi:hypothetical protein